MEEDPSKLSRSDSEHDGGGAIQLKKVEHILCLWRKINGRDKTICEVGKLSSFELVSQNIVHLQN